MAYSTSWIENYDGLTNASVCVIRSERTDMDSLRTDLRHAESGCRMSVDFAENLNRDSALSFCWEGLSRNGKDNIYLAVSEDYKILNFKQR